MQTSKCTCTMPLVVSASTSKDDDRFKRSLEAAFEEQNELEKLEWMNNFYLIYSFYMLLIAMILTRKFSKTKKKNLLIVVLPTVNNVYDDPNEVCFRK